MSRNFTPDELLIDRLLLNDTEAFEELHHRYCYSLFRYCTEKLNSPEDAKRIIRDIFISLWENRHYLPVGFSVSLHLYTEVRKAVIRCVDEKLLDKASLPAIEKKIIPGFKVAELQKAKQPVTTQFKMPVVFDNANRRTDMPWWNTYPNVPGMKGFKQAFLSMLNLL